MATELLKQLIAVRKNGLEIQHILNPSEKVQLEAVIQNPNALSLIENPTKKVQLEAVKRNLRLIM